MCSSNSKKIISISKKIGADVPFVRPNYLSSDKSNEWLVWQHALDFINKKENYYPDAIVILPVTSPLRNKSDIKNSIKIFLSKKADCLVSLTQSSKNPYFNMVKVKNNKVEKIFKKKHFIRRQDVPKVYSVTTIVYIVKSNFLRKSASFWNGKIIPYFVKPERAVDIDTKFDLKFAEYLNKK